MRKLATIRRIGDVYPIKGKDRVEMVKVDGWECMVSKSDNFKKGDLCVYCEIDSVFPQEERWQFLAKYNYRIKTQRFKDSDGNPIYSQGLVLPVSVVNKSIVTEGSDVTKELGITVYTTEPEEIVTKKKWPKFLMKQKWFRNIVLGGNVYGEWPAGVHKTDQERLQNIPDVVNKSRAWTMTEKIDGTSCTFVYRRHSFMRNEFMVCSRNNRIMHDDGRCYWKVAKKYDIQSKLAKMSRIEKWKEVVLQGECIGPKVQKNRYGLDDYALYAFDVYVDGKKLESLLAKRLLAAYDIPFVPIVDIVSNSTDFFSACQRKSTLYDGPAEGLVCRSSCGKYSFKVINPEYLVKNNC